MVSTCRGVVQIRVITVATNDRTLFGTGIALPLCLCANGLVCGSVTQLGGFCHGSSVRTCAHAHWNAAAWDL